MVGALTARLRPVWAAVRVDRLATVTTTAVSLLLVFLLVWLFVGPSL